MSRFRTFAFAIVIATTSMAGSAAFSPKSDRSYNLQRDFRLE